MHTNTSYATKKFPYDFYITPECHIKLNEYARAAVVGTSASEIGGLARLQVDDEEKNIFIIDVEMLPQRSSAAFFEVDAEALNEWTRNMIKSGRGDEIPEWKSMVHSHPVGMGPQMSGVDVEEIKKFAAESDAFSLIISASRTGDSSNMKMHYCYNVKADSSSPFFESGEAKQLIQDIPVGMAISGERLDMANEMTSYLIEKIGVENLSQKDIDDLQSKSETFMSRTIPAMPTAQRDALRKEIEKHVEELIEPRSMISKHVIGNRKTTTNQKIEDAVKEARNRYENDRMRMEQDKEIASQLSNEEQAYLNSGLFTEFEKSKIEIEDLFAIGFDATDPMDLSRHVSNKEAKKARKKWQNRVSTLNTQLRAECGIGLYDWVVVDYKQVHNEAPKTPINARLANEAHEVTDFTDNHGSISFEVGEETFWAHELKLIRTFEKHMADEQAAFRAISTSREEEDDRKRQKGIMSEDDARRDSLQRASAALDGIMNKDPRDEMKSEKTIPTT